MRPPRFAVNVSEGDLPFGQPSNCVVAILKGEEHLFHRNRHRVFGKSCPRHGLGFFGLKNKTEQSPVDSPMADGFAFVGAVAVDALLADMNLPASEIGGCGFHRVGGYY